MTCLTGWRELQELRRQWLVVWYRCTGVQSKGLHGNTGWYGRGWEHGRENPMGDVVLGVPRVKHLSRQDAQRGAEGDGNRGGKEVAGRGDRGGARWGEGWGCVVSLGMEQFWISMTFQSIPPLLLPSPPPPPAG